jgi:NADH-quinone oxidoreductase subunit N
MDLHGLQVADLTHLAPELTLVISAIILSLIDLFMPKHASRTILGWLTLVGIIVSAVFTSARLGEPKLTALLGGSYIVDDFGNILKLVLLGATGLIVLMSIGSIREEEIPHRGEYYYLFLPAVLGAMVMTSSADLITLFVGLELLSITSYIMVGMRKKDRRSNESAFKYLVLGGISSAVILYGMSFLYGITGSTILPVIRSSLTQSAGSYDALAYVAAFLLIAGFGFKIAAAPFHTWAPDVYQGAPTPIAAFLAVVSKAAGFALLFRIVYTGFFNVSLGDLPFSRDILLALAVLAAAAMIVGNLTALHQKNVKRLLAYSGIANAGYLLVPIAAQFALVHFENFSEFTYYLIAYALMNIGAFAVLMVVEQNTGTEEMSGFAGLYHRAPWTAAAMTILVLSLSGIPLTGGFFGKIFIMFGALQTHLYWLAAIMIITSVISFYYYFGFIRQMYMRSDADADSIRLKPALAVTIWMCTAASVVMAIFPHEVLHFIQTRFSLISDLFMGA